MGGSRHADLWRRILDARIADVHTAMPGEVRAFDASAQTVTVQPLIQHAMRDSDGNDLIESYPEIRGVPVLYPRAGGFAMAWPLSVGDPVLILFAEWALTLYREKGSESHPGDLQKHGFAGAMALPVGPYKASDTISETIDGLVVGYDGGALIRIKDDGSIGVAQSGTGVVSVGAEGATQQLLLGTKFRTAQKILSTALQTVFTACATGWTAMSVGWTAVGTFGGAVAGDATMSAHPITKAAAGVLASAAAVAATAAGVASGACTTGASAVGTFESSAAPDDYLSSKAKTVP